MTTTRRFTITAVAAALLLAAAVAAEAQYRRGRYAGENVLRISAGLFEPDGDSSYFDDKALDFTGDPQDLEDVSFTIDYARNLSERLKLVVSGSFFEGETDQEYLDFVDTFGDPIVHTTTLGIHSATAGLSLDLAPARSPVIPYVGVGGGLYLWELEESGEFIDFFVDPPEIFPATFQDEGAVFGWYWMAGVDVPLGPGWSLFAQGRWHYAEDELEDDFSDLGDLDLGGREVTAGFSWRF